MAIDIASFTDLDAVAADANGALDRDRQPSLFDRLSWFRLLSDHCEMPGPPLIVRARDGVGTAWMVLAHQSRRKATAYANWYSLETGLMTSGTVSPELVRALALWLRTSAGIAAISFEPITRDRADVIAAPFRDAGWLVDDSATTANWSIALGDGGWGRYLAGRPGRLRNTLRRKSGPSNLATDIITCFSEDRWDIYKTIYNNSWKPAEGSPDFLKALAQQEGAAGTLRLGLAHSGTTPVAAQFWLVENGIATIHKLAHVETSRAQSPGTILTGAMFRHAIEQDRVHRIDFGTGDDAYKADWVDSRRPLYRISLHDPRSATGLLGAARERLSTACATIRGHREN